MNMKRIAVFGGLVMMIAISAGAVDVPKTPFAMDPPPGWKTDLSGSSGALIFFADTPRENFAANINVVTEKAQGLTLDEYFDLSNENFAKLITNFKPIKREKITIHGIPFGTVEYKGTQGKIDMRVFQAFTVYHDMAYVFTGVSLEKYAGEYIPLIKRSFQTIRLAGTPGNPNPQSPPHHGGKSEISE